VILIARHGVGARKRTIPLGPFLAFGAVVSLLTHGAAFVSF
jgi:prepilin signal peptidase PulO-like enzyme (type II secretory pathway)